MQLVFGGSALYSSPEVMENDIIIYSTKFKENNWTNTWKKKKVKRLLFIKEDDKENRL